MPKRIVIIDGHPDSRADRFVHALSQSYGDGAREAGHLKSLERNVLSFCGISPIRASVIGMVEAASDARRKGWLRKTRRLGARGI